MPDDKLPKGRIEDAGGAKIAAKAEKAKRNIDSGEKSISLEKIILEEDKEKAIAKIEAEKIKKAFDADTTINGIRIVVKWDEAEKGYVIFLPDIDLKLARKKGVYVQEARITDSPFDAQSIFKYACDRADKGKDVYEIYNSALSLSKDLAERKSFGRSAPQK
jgi:hypothetical protein